MLLCVLLFFESCHNEELPVAYFLQQISGRDDGTLPFTRPLIYRIKVPRTWITKIPETTASLVDTMKPLCEFYCPQDKEPFIYISIHNFPLQERAISPLSQVARWKGQFETLDAAKVSVIPQAFNGFLGVRFEASGILHKKETTILSWAMQVAPIHMSTLHLLNQAHLCADWTIKATGPPTLIARYKAEIVQFARSFEFIEEIPSSTL
jgi:hypothetical protein